MGSNIANIMFDAATALQMPAISNYKILLITALLTFESPNFKPETIKILSIFAGWKQIGKKK
jgi:hypothetical protein